MTHHHAGTSGHDASLWKGAVSGAVAGAVSGFVMEKVQTTVMPQIKQGIKHARESVRAVSERHERERAASGNGHGGQAELPHAHTRGHVTYESGGHEQTVQVDRPDTAEATEQELRKEGGEEKAMSDSQRPATVKAAEAVTDVVGHELEESEEKPAGRAAHYAMAVTSGTIYGIAAEYGERATFGYGTAFGTAVWLAADEVIVPALGLSKKPTEYPAETHAYALASHLVYGATTELVRRNVRRALD